MFILKLFQNYGHCPSRYCNITWWRYLIARRVGRRLCSDRDKPEHTGKCIAQQEVRQLTDYLEERSEVSRRLVDCCQKAWRWASAA